MAVTQVTKKIGLSSTTDERLNDTYDCEYFVHTDTLITEDEAKNASDGTTAIPQMYVDRHPNNPNALLINKTAKQHKDQPLLWEVSCKYSTKTPDPSQQSQDKEDILDEPPSVNLTTERVQVVVEKDKDGNDIKNSAGDPFFDPGVEGDEIRRVYAIGFNAEYYSEELALDFIDSINSDEFQISDKVFPAKSLRIMDITAELRFAKTFRYFRVNMVIKYRKKLWSTEVQDRGMYAKNEDTDERQRVRVGASDAPTAQLLTEGYQLAEDLAAEYLTFWTLDEQPFADLLTFCRQGRSNLDLITIHQSQEES